MNLTDGSSAGGVELWTDDGDGVFEDGVDAPITLGSTPSWTGTGPYSVVLDTGGETIAAAGHERIFVVVRVSANAEHGETFSVRIPSGGIRYDSPSADTRTNHTLTSTEYTIDTVVPYLTGVLVTDVDGDNEFTAGDRITLSFSEAMDVSSLDATNVDARLTVSNAHVFDSSNGGGVAWANDAQSVEITLGASPDLDHGDTVALTNLIEDLAGNGSAVNPTLTMILDDVPPQLVSITWVDNDSNGYFTDTDEFILQFSELLDVAPVVGDLVLSGGSFGAVNIAQGADMSTFTVTTTGGSSLLPGTYLDPASTVIDVAGNGDATPAPGIELVDNIAPTLDTITLSTANTITGVDAGDQLVLVFSEPMTEADIALLSIDGASVSFTSTVWNPSSDTATVTVGVGGDDVYAGMTVDDISSLTDVGGNVAVQSNPSAELVDNEAPVVLAASSIAGVVTTDDVLWTDADQNGQISDGDSFSIYFSERMDPTTVSDLSNYVVDSGNSLGDGVSLVQSVDERSVTITLGSDSEIVDGETVSLLVFIRDRFTGTQSGNQLTVAQTVTFDDVGAPTLVSADFINLTGTTGLDAGDQIEFAFSEPMDTTTLDTVGELNGNLTVLTDTGAATGLNPFGASSTVSWDADGKIATVSLAAGIGALDLDDKYIISPTGTVTDIAGNGANTTSVLLNVGGNHVVSKLTSANDVIDAPSSSGSAVAVFGINAWQPLSGGSERLDSVMVTHGGTSSVDDFRYGLWSDANSNGTFEYGADTFLPSKSTVSGSDVTIEVDASVVLPATSGGPIDFFVTIEVLNVTDVAYNETLILTIDDEDVQFSNGPLSLSAAVVSDSLSLTPRTVLIDEVSQQFANFVIEETTSDRFSSTVVTNSADDNTFVVGEEYVVGDALSAFPDTLGGASQDRNRVRIDFTGRLTGGSVLSLTCTPVTGDGVVTVEVSADLGVNTVSVGSLTFMDSGTQELSLAGLSLTGTAANPVSVLLSVSNGTELSLVDIEVSTPAVISRGGAGTSAAAVLSIDSDTVGAAADLEFVQVELVPTGSGAFTTEDLLNLTDGS
ncbi:MAG: Ig-like domain-containing protein, partial [Chloroflexi bacterium]|nr:Ig-like domain-containing protein [Chloroflexota bacterium]